ncbi:hypothetical protein CN507_27695 [Bacillus cereus]|nr:hypothetical protein CN507_27695 [Bacillus cereus]
MLAVPHAHQAKITIYPKTIKKSKMHKIFVIGAFIFLSLIALGGCVAMEPNHAISIRGHYPCTKKGGSSIWKTFLFKDS